MATIDKVAMGAARFFDTEVRPSLHGAKAILYGVAVGMAISNANKMAEKYMSMLKMIGAADDDGNIDVEAVGAELKRQMKASGGTMKIEIGGANKDEFTFDPSDVDHLIDYINRA